MLRSKAAPNFFWFGFPSTKVYIRRTTVAVAQSASVTSSAGSTSSTPAPRIKVMGKVKVVFLAALTLQWPSSMELAWCFWTALGLVSVTEGVLCYVVNLKVMFRFVSSCNNPFIDCRPYCCSQVSKSLPFFFWIFCVCRLTSMVLI